MKYCNQCGQELMDEATVCTNCGVKCQGVYLDAAACEQKTKQYVRPKWHVIMSFIANILVTFSVFFMMLFVLIRMFAVRGVSMQDLEAYITVAIIFASFHFVLSVVIMILYLSLVKKKNLKELSIKSLEYLLLYYLLSWQLHLIISSTNKLQHK